MTKIDKNANLYDIDGNLIAKAPLKAADIETVEALLQRWTNKCKEDPENEMYKIYLNNTYATLMQLYRIYGNPHEQELIGKIKDYEEKYGEIKGELTSEQVKEAINTIAAEIEEPEGDEYVDYEEVKESTNE